MPGFDASAGVAASAAGSRRERSGKARGRHGGLAAPRPGGPRLKTYTRFSQGGSRHDVGLRLMRDTLASLDG